MVRTSSPIPLRSPSPHTLLTTLSDPLQQRQPAGMRRSQSVDQQQQQQASSRPQPTSPAPATRSPSRRKLPAIPPGAANTKFPSVIRITRAQLQQVMKTLPEERSSTCPPPLFSSLQSFISVAVLPFCWLVLLSRSSLRSHEGCGAGQTEHGSHVSRCHVSCE